MKNFNTFKVHPWHGIDPGANCPEEIRAFIEIVSTDTVKYEIDKTTGYLSIDRPQMYSNTVPSLYGFIPKTYCGQRVAALSAAALPGRGEIQGDGDPLDVCVLTEKEISHGDIIANCTPIGGIRLLDKSEADDKIIAVLKNDAVYGSFTDINELPNIVVRRLVHYFTTYKEIPGESETARMEVVDVYDRATALKVILESMADYRELIAAD